jgi:RNA polymerase sigma-70 factor (ECF subfamily)
MEGQLVAMVDRVQPAAATEYSRAVRERVAGAYRLAGLLLGDGAEAQDAVQDALVKAWRSWASLRDPASFGPWFDRIVVNVCRDRMRRHRGVRLVELEAADEVEARDAFRAMFARDEAARAVATLDPDHRVVVVLRFWRDMSLEQVADVLELPLGTVKSRLHYALRALREELGGSNDEG